MAPEQIEGKNTDSRTDIFAFGAVLYEMVSGRKAFTGTSQASLLAAILKEEPTRVSEVQPVAPPALEYLIRTCLAKAPDERFLAAHDVALQLRWIASEAIVGSPAPSGTQRIGRERLPWLVAAVSLAVLIPIVVWWILVPRVERRDVMRFTFLLPDGQRFSRVGRHVLALSPDGTKLAYVANGQLYLRLGGPVRHRGCGGPRISVREWELRSRLRLG
jgi:serine/threonine protein kinase